MKLSVYDFNEAPVRAFLDENGEPWFVAADICRVLEIANTSQAVAELEDDERNTLCITEGIRSGAGNPNVNTISESGLYALVFKSRKPEAKTFRKWVTKEVLPAIRKTGRYETGSAALESAEELMVAGVIDELAQAIREKRAGKLANGDATVLANLVSQYLRAWEVKLRLRAGGQVPQKGMLP